MALTSSVSRRVHSSRLRLFQCQFWDREGNGGRSYITVEYSSSVSNCINALRNEGITYAGLCFARRPINPTAVTRFSKTSSFKAMNNDRTFSACARCLSNRSLKFSSTVSRIFGSGKQTTFNFSLPQGLNGTVRTRICYSYGQKFVKDVADNLDRMTAGLVSYGILYE